MARKPPSTDDHAWLTGRQPRSASPAIRQLDALLVDRERVAHMPSVELHRMVTEIGLADAQALLEIAKPEQVRDLVDLQVWRAGKIDGDELLDWVHALTQLPDDVSAQHLRALDVELVGFLLRTRIKIYLASEDEIPGEPEGMYYETPDGWFVLDIMPETEARIAQLIEIIETLYRDDQDATRRLLANLMWELPSELLESSLRWRNGRMQDLGFAEPIEALRIYAYVDPQTVSADDNSADRPLAADPEPVQAADPSALVSRDERSFWTRAMDRVSDPAERDRLGTALMSLCNLNLSADRVDPADREHAAQSLNHLRGRLSLGLSHLCAGDIERAPGVLAHVALMRIARLGHSLVLDLQRRLLPRFRQARLGRAPRRLDLLDRPSRDRLSKLMAHPPTFVNHDGVERPFSYPEDIDQTAQLVEAALLTSELVPPDTWPTDLPPSITLPALFCTAVVNHVLGRQGPLDRGAISALRDHLDGEHWDGELHSAALELGRERLARPLDRRATALITAWLATLADELLPIDPEVLDLRFIEGLHVASGS